MDQRKLAYRIRVECACGASIACKTRVVGKIKNCPTCGKNFQVPFPAPPPHGTLWVVHQRLTEFEYKQHATALTDYSNAVDAKNEYPELYWHITRTLEIIEQFREPVRQQPAVLSQGRQEKPVSILENLAKGSSFGGCWSAHRRYT